MAREYKINMFTKSPLYYTVKYIDGDKHTEGSIIELTGCFPEGLNVGDTIDIDKYYPKCEVTEIIENRDCKGVFNNPNDSVKSFYKIQMRVTVPFTRPQAPPVKQKTKHGLQ